MKKLQFLVQLFAFAVGVVWVIVSYPFTRHDEGDL